eukprot:11973734-Prorocentrum_lima.AAC.1
MEKLRIIEKLLCVHYHRDRFRATCLEGCPDEDEVFQRFPGSIYEARWFAVYNFVQRIGPMVKIMVLRWDVHRYIDGFSQDKRNEEQDKQFNPHLVRGVLDDKMFHGYNQLLIKLGCVLKGICRRMEACPCHYQASS